MIDDGRTMSIRGGCGFLVWVHRTYPKDPRGGRARRTKAGVGGVCAACSRIAMLVLAGVVSVAAVAAESYVPQADGAEPRDGGETTPAVLSGATGLDRLTGSSAAHHGAARSRGWAKAGRHACMGPLKWT